MIARNSADKKAASKKVNKKATANPKSKSRLAAATRAKTDADFAPTFAALKRVMSTFVDELRVVADEPKKFYVATKSLSWRGGPMFFGSVSWGKAYVSYHLMLLYVYPELAKTISAQLKKRMQGKACFNFRVPDEARIAELGVLTKAGLDKFRSKNLL